MSNEPPKLKLVKRFDSTSARIVLQFYDQSERPVGPTFANRALAIEWYVRALAARYKQPERRASHLDRRRLDKSGFQGEKRQANGRRFSDQEPELLDTVAELKREIAGQILASQKLSASSKHQAA